jgi:hypothetical protein
MSEDVTMNNHPIYRILFPVARKFYDKKGINTAIFCEMKSETILEFGVNLDDGHKKRRISRIIDMADERFKTSLSVLIEYIDEQVDAIENEMYQNVS